MYSQTPPIAVDNPDIHIFPSDNSQHEVHISINKTNPLNLIVSANTYTNTYSQGHYYTLDGGITWFGGDDLPEDGSSLGDPATSFDASGRGYIAGMAKNSSGTGADGYVVQHTDDRGVSWSNQKRGSGPAGGFDKEMIVTVDEMQSSPYANNFYCAWTDFGDGSVVKVNRSTDGTNSFDNEHILSDDFGQGTNVQIGPNGEVYVCWANYTDGNIPADDIGFALSTDGGMNYSSSIPFSYKGIRTTNSSNSNFGFTRVNDFPSMAVDKSCGDFRGRIYIAYPEFENENSTRSVIRVRFSDNNGNSWSTPTTINIPNGRQNWFPWIAVDDLTGLVNVIYYSLDQDAEDAPTATNTYVAYSTDGGVTWQNIKVSDVSHDTAPIDNSTFANGYAGDYIGIASFQGTSFATWTDDRNGTWQVYVSRIDFDIPTIVSSQTNLAINNPSLLTGERIYQAFQNIKVADLNNVTIDNNANVELVAGNEIVLKPGFSTEPGAEFVARIDNVSPCSTPGATSFKRPATDWINEENIIKDTQDDILTFAYPNPSKDYITIGCLNKGYDEASIIISDINGKNVYSGSATYISKEQIRHIVNIRDFPTGTYVFTIQLNGKNLSSKFIKQ
jgi:hypothetical protein